MAHPRCSQRPHIALGGRSPPDALSNVPGDHDQPFQWLVVMMLRNRGADDVRRRSGYFANSTARVSRMTVTLIWPG